MIVKDFRYYGNADDQRLDAYLDKVSRQAATVRVVEYAGNGQSARTVELETAGLSFAIIQRKGYSIGAVPTQPVFAWSINAGVSYVVGGSSITDGIMVFANGGIVVGSNAAVNGVGFDYILMGV